VTEKPLRIAHVLAPADVGGLETVVRALALGHSAMGHSVDLIAVLESPRNRFVDEARDAGIRVHIVVSPARSIRRERSGVRDFLTRNNVDVLHSHGYRSDILDLGIARRMMVPSVTTLHGFSSTDRKGRVYEWLQLRGARRASAIVAVSTNVADRVIASGAPRDSVHLIRNATPPTPTPLSAEAARTQLGIDAGQHIGWIGRLSAEKGPDVMVEAMRHLGDLTVTLSFIGDGPDLSLLKRQADAAGVARRVTFHGSIRDAAALIPAFDVIALSSRTEGTPMVVLEAMAARVPIVASRVGGIPDMLSATEALLVDPEDPVALASAIRTTLTDPLASAERAARAHERMVADFDLHRWLVSYENLYRSIQHSRPERRA
jgi:glycosyltransferase involved in cell wall biosynthesis